MFLRVDKQNIETRPFINGEFRASHSGLYFEKKSSVTGEQLPKISACDEQDVKEAVAFAKDAFEAGIWSDMPVAKRKQVMLRLADFMEEHLEQIASLDAYETGRAFQNYLNDSIPKAIEAIRYFAEAVDKIYDQSVSTANTNLCIIKREALGVVAIITPWNDPMVVASWKFAPALLMGNSVIMKPAELSSYSMLYVARLAKQAGIPDGVLQVLPGRGEIVGKALALHKDIDGVFFTGSSEVGKLLIQYSGMSNMKRVALECGGKGPYIVTSHVGNLKESADTLAKNMFYNQGQICSAPSRVYVHESVYEQFLRYLEQASEKYVPQNPFDSNSTVGCVVSQEQFDKIQGYIKVALQENATVYTASAKSDLPKEACGVRPTILTNLSSDSRLLREEIFGPVVCVQKYTDKAEVVKRINDSIYGLAGAVWTDDLNEAHYFANQIKVGLFHVNSYGEDDNTSPFGGFKQSGNGKDKSIYAFDEYTEKKSIWMKIR